VGNMVGKNITREDLVEAVYQGVGLPRAEAAAFVKQVIKAIYDTLATGEMVKLSSFGVFRVCEKGKRVDCNPKTNVEVPVEALRVTTTAPRLFSKHISTERPPNHLVPMRSTSRFWRARSMKRRLEPGQMRSTSASAVYGWLTGFAESALHQINSALSNDIPDDVYMHVVSELIIGALGGAILFAAVALLLKGLKL
jgi:integration host factor subunit alpha